MYTHVVRNRNVHPDSSLWHNIQARPRGKIRPRWPVKDMLDTGVQLLVYTWSYTEWGILQFQNSRVPKHVMFVTKVHLPASRASRVGMRGWSKKQLFAHLGAMPDLTLTSWWNSAFREAGWIWLEGGIFFCADCLILVLMYWTIRFFFLVASTPTQLAQLSNHVILFGYTNHTYRERRMCLSNSQLGGEKKLLSENEAKILFRLIPLVLQFSSSSCLQGHADGLWTFPGYATLDLACRAPFAVCWVRKTVLNVVKPC